MDLASESVEGVGINHWVVWKLRDRDNEYSHLMEGYIVISLHDLEVWEGALVIQFWHTRQLGFNLKTDVDQNKRKGKA